MSVCKLAYLAQPAARCNLLKYLGDNTAGVTAWAMAETAADRGVGIYFAEEFPTQFSTSNAIVLINVGVADAFDNRRGGGGGGGGFDS